MTTRVIRIVIDSRGARKGGKDVENALGGVDKKAQSAEKSVVGVRGALIATAALLVAREVIRIGDAYQSLQGQLRLVTDSSRQLATTTQTLFDISNRTRQSIEATSSLYIRLGRSTDFSNERIAQLTETIGQTIAISRAAPEQARAALFQLGQGFAAGALRGEELNSVMEQTPELAKAIADGLGVSIGALRVLGAEGALTAEAVAGALEKAADDVATDFAEVPLTVGDAVTKVGNAMTQFIGELDESVGLTSLLAKGLDGVAKTILGLKVIIGDDKGFGAEAGKIGKEIDDLRKKADDLRSEIQTGLKVTTGFLGFGPGDSDAAVEELAKVEAEIERLSQKQLRVLEPEVIRKSTDEAGKIFAAAIEDLNEEFELQEEAADKLVESVKTPVQKAMDTLAQLNVFVRDRLITEEEAGPIRQRLDDIINPLEEIEVNVEKRQLDDASQALLDAANRTDDLQEQLAALQSGGEEELRVTIAMQQARDVVEELGDAAGVTADELAGVFLAEAQAEEEIRKATDALKEQEDAIGDFLTRARENAQDILAGFLSDPIAEGLDELPGQFAKVLQDLAAQALAAEIFKLLGSFSGGEGGGGTGVLGFVGGAVKSFFGGAQEGATVGRGDFGVVGEGGPEVFQAPAAGTIVPNAAQAAPPVVNVNPQVINVQDPADIPAAMQGAEGESVILNVLRSNPDVIRQVAA